MNEQKHKTGFKVPAHYFDTLEETICNEIDLEVLPKDTGFIAPVGYFENVETVVLQTLNFDEKPKSVIGLNSRKTLVYVSAVAACFAIIVSVFYSNKSIVKQIDSIKTSSIENYIDEGFIDLKSYEVLALLDDEDIVNIDLESNIFSEESLENYLLENRIEETFLIE